MRAKAKNRAFIYFLLMMPFIEPQLFKNSGYESLDRAYAVGKAISAVIVIFLYIYKKMGKVSLSVVLITLMQMMTFVCTLYNKGSFSRFMGPALTSIAVVMIGQLVFEKDSGIYFLKYVEICLTSFVFIHIIGFVFNVIRGGIVCVSQSTILGIKNRWIYILLPWTIIGFIKSYMLNRRVIWREWIKYFVSFFFVTVSGAVGAIIAFLGFGGAYLFTKIWIRNMKNRVDFVKFYIGILIYNVLLVSEVLLEPLRYVVVRVFNKDVTLSGRVYLWRTVLSELKKNAIFAKGVQAHDVDMNYFYVNSGWVLPCKVNHPHNYFLNAAHQGGIIAVTLFIVIWWMCMIWLNKIEQKNYSGLPIIMISSFTAFFLASSVDTLDYSLFYLLIPLCIRIGREFGEKKYAAIDSNSSL